MLRREDENDKSGRWKPLVVLFLVVMVDMIGFGIIIPFLTFFIDDLASAKASSKLVLGSHHDGWLFLSTILVFPLLGHAF